MQASLANEVDSWMNYRARTVESGPVVAILEDHRGVIPVAMAALELSVFTAPPILFRWDAHADLGGMHGTNEPTLAGTIEEIRAACDSDLRSDDGGWASTAINQGLVESMCTWFVQEGNLYNGEVLNKRMHLDAGPQMKVPIWLTGTSCTYFSACKAKQQWALDLSRECGLADYEGGICTSRDRNIWVDIDLDFAFEDGIVWTASRFQSEFGSSTPSGEMWHDIISHAELVTIATEPEWCGGLDNCVKILGHLGSAFSKEFFSW